MEHPLCGIVALLDRVISVDKDLGLDYGDEIVLLGERRVEGERLSVGLYTALRGDAIPYGYDSSPLGEARPEFGVFGEPLAESVEALGELLAFREGQIDGALVHLDTGDDAGVLERLGHGGAVRGLLAEGLVCGEYAFPRSHELAGRLFELPNVHRRISFPTTLQKRPRTAVRGP